MKKQPVIFIIEDNQTFKTALLHFLTQKGYTQIHTYGSGEECLENIFRRPDIVIQDYNLQGMNGMSVMLKLKQILPKTEFIFLSSRNEIDLAIEIIRNGAYDYVQKNELSFQRVFQNIEKLFIKLQKSRKNNMIKILIALFSILLLVSFLSYIFYKE